MKTLVTLGLVAGLNCAPPIIENARHEEKYSGETFDYLVEAKEKFYGEECIEREIIMKAKNKLHTDPNFVYYVKAIDRRCDDTIEEYHFRGNTKNSISEYLRKIFYMLFILLNISNKMAIEEILILDGKEFLIEIGEDVGIHVTPSELNKDPPTIYDLHYLSAVVFMYIGTRAKNIIFKPEAILELADNLYTSFYKKYKGVKSIQEMTLQEFNEMIKKYNGRS